MTVTGSGTASCNTGAVNGLNLPLDSQIYLTCAIEPVRVCSTCVGGTPVRRAEQAIDLERKETLGTRRGLCRPGGCGSPGDRCRHIGGGHEQKRADDNAKAPDQEPMQAVAELGFVRARGGPALPRPAGDEAAERVAGDCNEQDPNARQQAKRGGGVAPGR